MPTDYAVQIRMTNLNAALSGVDAEFLSKLNSDELRSLLNKLTEAENKIRQELQNVSKRPR